MLAPELAPGRVEGPIVGSDGFAGGTVGVVLGDGIPPDSPPGPPPGVVGAVAGVAVLGLVPGVAVPGVAVPGVAVLGVAVLGVAVLGVAVLGAVVLGVVPGAGVSVVRSGLVVVVPGGGPESGARIGGILVVLDGSEGLAGAGPDSMGPTLGFTSGLSGVRSFAPGAFGPNGLRPSIGPFCASVVPVHVIRSYEALSAIRTSAGADRSAASASSTTTGCKNSMAHPPYEMLL